MLTSKWVFRILTHSFFKFYILFGALSTVVRDHSSPHCLIPVRLCRSFESCHPVFRSALLYALSTVKRLHHAILCRRSSGFFRLKVQIWLFAIVLPGRVLLLRFLCANIILICRRVYMTFPGFVWIGMRGFRTSKKDKWFGMNLESPWGSNNFLSKEWSESTTNYFFIARERLRYKRDLFSSQRGSLDRNG